MSGFEFLGRLLGAVAEEAIKEYRRSGATRDSSDEAFEKRLGEKLEAFAEVAQNISRFEEAVRRRDGPAFTKRQRRHAEPPVDKEPPSFEAAVTEHAVPAIALVRPYPPRHDRALRSHVGGRPDLPNGVDWPRAADRKPLHFVAQVDFAECPDSSDAPATLLPATGTLMFFVRLDGEMLLDEQDSVALIFDPTSSGRAAPPPEDLPPIDKHWASHFMLPGETASSTHPCWPLRPVAIRSAPDAAAFDRNARYNGRFDRYIRDLRRFRADEIRHASGLEPADENPWPDLGLFGSRVPGEPMELRDWRETGFPWVARGIVLVSRAALRRCERPEFAGFARQFDECRVSAEARPPSQPVTVEEAGTLVALLNAMMRADVRLLTDPEGVERRYFDTRVSGAMGVAIHRLITEAGDDPDLAHAIPATVYAAAYSRHAPLTVNKSSGGQHVRHMQMLGFVSGTQGALPIGSRTMTLLQLPTDPGVDLILGDSGELDFHLEPEQLAARDWYRAIVGYAGG